MLCVSGASLSIPAVCLPWQAGLIYIIFRSCFCPADKRAKVESRDIIKAAFPLMFLLLLSLYFGRRRRRNHEAIMRGRQCSWLSAIALEPPACSERSESDSMHSQKRPTTAATISRFGLFFHFIYYDKHKTLSPRKGVQRNWCENRSTDVRICLQNARSERDGVIWFLSVEFYDRWLMKEEGNSQF